MVFLNEFLNLFSCSKNSSTRQGLPGTALGTMSRWKCHQLPGNIKTRALSLRISIVLFFLVLSSWWFWLFYQGFYIAPKTTSFKPKPECFTWNGSSCGPVTPVKLWTQKDSKSRKNTWKIVFSNGLAEDMRGWGMLVTHFHRSAFSISNYRC